MRSSLQQQGYDPCACCSVDADDLAALVGGWPVGTVVERRLNELVVREIPGDYPWGSAAGFEAGP